METMNVVLAVDRDPGTGAPTRFLVGVADRATRNWLAMPALMAAPFLARRIEAGIRFETFFAGESGPVLTLVQDGESRDLIVGRENPDSGISLDDLPPCGSARQPVIYRGGRPI